MTTPTPDTGNPDTGTTDQQHASPWVALYLCSVLAVVLAPLWIDFSGSTCADRTWCWVDTGLPEGHDVAFHAVVARAAARSLEADVAVPNDPWFATLDPALFYPTWVDSIQGSLGGPVFLIYPPLSSFTSAVIETVAGLDVTQALRVSASLALSIALLSFYWAARWIGCRRWASAIAASAYVIAPSPIIDLHERFALATVWAYAWLPLLVASFCTVCRRPHRTAWLLLVASSAALLLTHIITCVLLAAASLVWIVALLLQHLRTRQDSTDRRRESLGTTALRLAAAGIGALGIAAVFLVPMLLTRDQVLLEFIRTSDHGVYQRNFLFFNEVANGYSAAVIKPLVQTASLVQLLVGIALLALWRWLLAPSGSSSAKLGNRFFWVALISVAWVFVLQTPLSAPLWASTPISWAQFPWRFGAMQSLQIAALVLLVANSTPRPWLRRGVCALALFAALVTAWPALRSTDFIFPSGATEIDARAHELWVPEYLPADWPIETTPAAASLIARSLEGAPVADTSPHPAVERFDTTGSTGGTLAGPLSFPGWTATVDGSPQSTTTSQDHRVHVSVPPGSRDVVLRYRAPWRRLGAPISLLSLLALWPASRWLNY